MTYIVHGAVRSSASWRVRIAMKLKGLPAREIFYDLAQGAHHDPAYRAVNPQALVPALILEDGTMLSQSMAIIEYLDEAHPEPPLLPSDAKGRARVRALAQIVACDIHPVNNMRVRNHIRDLFPDDPDATGRWMERWSREGFDALEARLSRDAETGRFCHGDAPTLADICLVPQVANARLASRDLSAWPTIVRIADACDGIPAFDAARPERQV